MLFSAICSLDVVKICLFVFCVCVKSFISKNLPPVFRPFSKKSKEKTIGYNANAVNTHAYYTYM